mmetsp:Transcript_1994/g.7153  ORF Transcript_1994/g.7153 Transcript_1994/m.7153 type:complete len:257 (+) Transcript_1994:2187-2957(+)
MKVLINAHHVQGGHTPLQEPVNARLANKEPIQEVDAATAVVVLLGTIAWKKQQYQPCAPTEHFQCHFLRVHRIAKTVPRPTIASHQATLRNSMLHLREHSLSRVHSSLVLALKTFIVLAHLHRFNVPMGNTQLEEAPRAIHVHLDTIVAPDLSQRYVTLVATPQEEQHNVFHVLLERIPALQVLRHVLTALEVMHVSLVQIQPPNKCASRDTGRGMDMVRVKNALRAMHARALHPQQAKKLHVHLESSVLVAFLFA